MSFKKNPATLFNISLREVSKMLLLQWRSTFYVNYIGYSEELKSKIGVLIPYTIYDQIFELMVDSHARIIQNSRNEHDIPSVSALIDSIIIPNLNRLNLNCLRHMGTVKDEELRYLESILTTEIPNLSNLTEISLQTSGTEFTLPICNDDILDKVGSSCQKLKTLDISYNHTVTNKGLTYLIPHETRGGCPLLAKVTLFECSVTPEGVATLIECLPRLKFLGYRETGQSLMYLDRRSSSNHTKKLELAHVNNLGTIDRTCKDLYKLKCNDNMVSVIKTFCPKINGLKVRVNDSEMKFLQQLTSVSILELVFNLGTPSSPGSNTINYLNINGAQFISLSFVCDNFNIQSLKVVSEQCCNLARLWIRSNRFTCDQDIMVSDKNKCSLRKLEVFFFRVGHLRSEFCHVPLSVFNYVLHKSNILKEIVLSMKNDLICDAYIQELFGSIQTSQLKHVLILIPNKNVTVSSLNLSMSTAEALIGMCPMLEQLGNMLVWDVSLEEIQELRRQLKISNSALVIVYRMVYS